MGFFISGDSQDIGNGLDINEAGLMEVKQAVEQGKMDVLVIKRLDRFGRNKVMVSELLSILENRNITLYSPLEGHIAMDTYNGYSHK